ncbi:MAG: TIR domain-containing protein [Gammaproteobacteria bacterium]|nr:TIR domain-containing protein [Gammaproteobacteria bacterium]
MKVVMKKRQVFYSFHYKPDNWRASQVRNIGVIEGNSPVSDNEWETVKKGGDYAIERWIDSQMEYRSCTVVLVGRNTANRRWINYEIAKSWNDGMGVVGIRIHGLKDSDRHISLLGGNPFDYVEFNNGKKLSSVVKCYNPQGRSSIERYIWIKKHISNAVEEAIKIRKRN